MVPTFLNALLLSLSFGFSVPAFAQDSVRLSGKELDAALVFVCPELTTIELNGRTGVFTPSPPVKFLGGEVQTFSVNIGGVVGMADIKFNHLKGSNPQVTFENDALVLELPVQDQAAAVETKLGSISVQSVSLIATLQWSTSQTGVQELVVVSTDMHGTLSGSGVFKSDLILNKVKNALLSVVANEVQKLLNKPKLQEAIQAGLVNWSSLYTGVKHTSVVSGSIHFFHEADTKGIEYQAGL